MRKNEDGPPLILYYIYIILIKYYFRMEEELTIPLGKRIQKGGFMAIVNTPALWQVTPISEKIKALIMFRWKPNETVVFQFAQDILREDTFGDEEDYGDVLFDMAVWHHNREWDYSFLTDRDRRLAESIDSLNVLTRLRYEYHSDLLSLKVWKRAPEICTLLHPITTRIPVLSVRNYLRIHAEYAFNSIRKAQHPQADKLIDFIYEVLFLQQKIAVSLFELLRKIDYILRNKNEAMIINAEMDAIILADTMFSYLKATIEKATAILGLTHGIENLSSKKKHEARLRTLDRELPPNSKSTYYFQFIWDVISVKNLDEINTYRTGILHQKGMRDLQPHEYIGKKAGDIPLRKIFEILIEQHFKNTLTLIGIFAMLTDKLVHLLKAEFSPDEIPLLNSPKMIQKMAEIADRLHFEVAQSEKAEE